MGGSAQADNEQVENPGTNANVNAHLQFLEQQNDKSGALDNSFDAPMRKPQTCIQQPNQERLEKDPTPIIKIPSGELSQSADSPGTRVQPPLGNKLKDIPK
jgi:hypothetical protein